MPEERNMTDQIEEVRLLTALAGLELPEERAAGLAASLTGTTRIAESLSRLDLSGHEPAAQFRAPPSRQ
jgi:hypothetical protein